jgi:membrane peptidoglycan carboxypeptidase
MLLPPAAVVQHVYFDRSDLPELTAFILFQPPTTGEVKDARGEVVIQLAREYRRVVTYDEVPLVVRQAILAAEDKNFLSHSVDYGAAAAGDREDGGALASSGRTAEGCGCGWPREARRSRSSWCASTFWGTSPPA